MRSQRPRPVITFLQVRNPEARDSMRHSEKRVNILVRVGFRLAGRGLEREGAKKLWARAKCKLTVVIWQGFPLMMSPAWPGAMEIT